MEFIETPTFTRLVLALMDDEDYVRLQATLALQPVLGKVIPGGGGIRKLRWAGRSRGKRGGLRVIYYWQAADNRIWMLFVYPKSERDDLTPGQLRQLRILVKEFLV
ncbi:MAG: type II toxin-antitoxin system RelE/ParE family toxin [Verrucomicrobia bacterium]|nr:type II toxin-antitoxin system RelE/ParE family toxin [Verrucomicrobiota bacterium]